MNGNSCNNKSNTCGRGGKKTISRSFISNVLYQINKGEGVFLHEDSKLSLQWTLATLAEVHCGLESHMSSNSQHSKQNTQMLCGQDVSRASTTLILNLQHIFFKRNPFQAMSMLRHWRAFLLCVVCSPPTDVHNLQLLPLCGQIHLRVILQSAAHKMMHLTCKAITC